MLLIWTSGAAADGFTSLNAKVRYNSGEVDRGGTVDPFDNDVQTSAHGVYELGDWTIFGGLETQRTDFSANGGAAEMTSPTTMAETVDQCFTSPSRLGYTFEHSF